MAKHILIPCQYFYPEQFRINDMAFEWVKRGYKVTVLTGIPNYPEGKFYEGYGFFHHKKETINGVTVIRIPLFARGKSKLGLILNYFSFPFFGFFWNLFTKLEADEVFMFETSPMNQCKIGVRYAKKHNIPCYLYVQDLWPENVEMILGSHNPIIVKPIERMVRKIYAGCTHIFGTSPSFVDAIRKYVPEDEKEKVSYWPQYAEEFYQPRAKSFLPDEFDSKEPVPRQTDEFRVIFTGNIGQAQGLDILPKAAALYRKKLGDIGYPLKFVIVGDGRAKEAFVESIRENGVEDMFEFVGRKLPTEIPKLLAAADAAFLSFANDELFAKTIPAKLQSYLACAMPIIASAMGESERIINEAGCGFCSPIGDEVSLENNIEKMIKLMLEQPAEFEAMSERAYKYNEFHFSKKTLMDEMDNYLK